MRGYVNDAWRRTLADNRLIDFDAIWNLEAGWFEEPNRRRGGWSGVSRCELQMPGAQMRAVFLKRQQNHHTFSWRHPIAGIPTAWREFRHIMRCRARAVPTLEPVYFAARRVEGGHQSILITEELTGFTSLDMLMLDRQSPAYPTAAARRRIIEAVAHLARAMHRGRIQHNCFYPKHIFVRICGDGEVEARVIDLEKSRWRPLPLVCALRDLDTLNRHAAGWSRSERLRFLAAYLGGGPLSAYGRWLWRALALRAARKRRSP